MGRISNSLLASALALFLAAAPASATTYFVSGTGGVTTGSDANNCTDWSTPCATTAGALGKTTPTIIALDKTGAFVANAAITWTLPQTQISIISSTNGTSGTTISPSAGASESVGTANAAFNVNCGNDQTKAYISGVTFLSGSGGTSAAVNFGTSSQGCSFQEEGGQVLLAGTSSNTINIGSSGSSSGVDYKSTGVTYGTTGGRTGTLMTLGSGIIEIINPTLSFSGIPNNLFAAATTGFPNLIMRDGDISPFNAGAIMGTQFHGYILLKNLKLGGSAFPFGSNTFSSGSVGYGIARNIDSGNTLYKLQAATLYGALSVDTSNFMNSGASFNGATASWKIVTTSSATVQTPFCAPLIETWNTNTSSQTLKVEIAQNSSATALTDLQIWSTLDYPNSASFPSYTPASNRNASPIVGTGSNQPTSVATWTGLTTPTTQYLPITFTAAANGLLQAQVCVAAASTTLWLNPGLTQ